MRAFALPLVALMVLATGCGGGGGSNTTSDPTPTPLAADSASAYLGTFLLSESQSADSGSLPTVAPAGDPGVYALAVPALPACIGVTSGGPGTPTTYTYNSCTGPNGTTLTGQITFSWSNSTCTLTYANFTAAKDTRTWVMNGTKTITVNATTHQSQVATTGITHVYTDTAFPADNRTFTYTCALLADWATAGAYKLSGTFSYLAAGESSALQGTIPTAAPLTWTAGCCYPSTGTVNLQKGLAKADLSFGLPCGTMTITSYGMSAVARTLTACP